MTAVKLGFPVMITPIRVKELNVIVAVIVVLIDNMGYCISIAQSSDFVTNADMH
jgi:hypothetical protein